MSAPGFTRKLVFLLSGFLVWAAHFGLVYGINGLACARNFASQPVAGASLVAVGVGAATAIAALVIVAVLALAIAGRGPGIRHEADGALRAFWRYGTIAIALLGVVAVLWSGLPVLIISPCA
jgi:hypothetical protein